MNSTISTYIWSRLARISSVVSLLLLAFDASAQIEYIGHFKVQTFTQTGTNPPAAPDHYYFAVSLNSDTNYDISLPDIFLPPDATSTDVVMNENGPGSFGYGTYTYTNKADFDADYPNGTYDYFIDWPDQDDNLQSEDVLVVLPSDDMYSPTAPAFTPQTFTAGQALDPSQDFQLAWVPYVLATNASFAHTFIGSYDSQTYDNRYGGFDPNCDPDQTSITMPAGTLDFGRTYGFLLYYSDRQSPSLTNSDGSYVFTIIGFDNLVTMYMTTIAPKLQIAPAPGGLVLTWPLLATNNYQLQNTTNLAAGNWLNVTNTPIVSGSNCTLSLSPSSRSVFYRLQPFSL